MERNEEEVPIWEIVLTEIAKGDLPGHEFHGNQWESSDHRLTGVTDTHIAFMRRQMEKFYGAGGKIESIESRKAVNALHGEVRRLMETANASGDIKLINGIEGMETALEAHICGLNQWRSFDGLTEFILTARDANGNLAACINGYRFDDGEVRIGSLGSAQIMPGAATALEVQVAQMAKGSKLDSQATYDATPYHGLIGRRLGRPYSMREDSNRNSWWDSKDIEKITSELSSPEVTVVKSTYSHWLDEVNPFWKTPQGKAFLAQNKITKGDTPGHKFHGNQWIDGEGNFVAPPEEGSAPNVPTSDAELAIRRLEEVMAGNPFGLGSSPPPTERPIQRPITLSPEEISSKLDGQNVKFSGFTSTKIVAPIGDTLKLGGALNHGFQKYEMADGSIAASKMCSTGYDDEPRPDQGMAMDEVRSALIGKAIDAPIRDCLPLPGGDAEVLMPWIEGQTNGELGENQIYSFAAADLNAKCCPEVVTQIQDMRFFDTLIGNIDRNAGNFMVVTPNKETADLRDPTTRIIGIDHGNVFGPPSPEGLRLKAKEYNISNERITEISNGLDKLSNIQGLDAGTLNLTNSLLRNLKEAFPHLNK